MRLTPHLLLLCSCGPILADGPGGVAAASSATSGAFRIENEYMLVVPQARTEELRDLLRRRYGPGSECRLKEFGPEFASRISDEGFVDLYFDTPELGVLAIEGGVRHRVRHNLENRLTDRKDGRQLVQLKLPRPGDPQVLNRTEIKFDVAPTKDPSQELDLHPLIGLVGPDQREAFLETVTQRGFDAREMSPILTVEQRRWRVYLSRNKQPFATLTLDEAESRWALWRVSLVQLEIELSEIFYTEARPEERAFMQSVSDDIAKDIFARFPELKQDQTPKYKKMVQLFSQRLPMFESLLLHRDLILTSTLVGGTWLLVGVAALVRRRRGWTRRMVPSLVGPARTR